MLSYGITGPQWVNELTIQIWAVMTCAQLWLDRIIRIIIKTRIFIRFQLLTHVEWVPGLIFHVCLQNCWASFWLMTLISKDCYFISLYVFHHTLNASYVQNANKHTFSLEFTVICTYDFAEYIFAICIRRMNILYIKDRIVVHGYFPSVFPSSFINVL